MYCFTTSISHGVEKYFPRLWGTGISDAISISCRPLPGLGDYEIPSMCEGVCVGFACLCVFVTFLNLPFYLIVSPARSGDTMDSSLSASAEISC